MNAIAPSATETLKRPTLRFRSQLLVRRSCRPDRNLRIRPVNLRFTFRPVRFGVKPKMIKYEYENDESS